MKKFLLLGGDVRQLYLSQILSRNGFLVTPHYKKGDLSHSIEETIKNNQIILCPIPFTRDNINLFSNNSLKDLNIENLLTLLTPDHILFGGSIPDHIKEYGKNHDISCFDYMDMEEVTVKNTIATAEGAIVEALKESSIYLHKSQCLITGFGRCGKTLALKLKGLNASVTVGDRENTKLTLAESMGFDTIPLSNLHQTIGEYSFIFNTIPALIFHEELIGHMKPGVTIIDIASSPGGVDYKFCNNQNIKAKLCPGLPGIYGPESSSQILFEAILKYLKQRSIL